MLCLLLLPVTDNNIFMGLRLVKPYVSAEVSIIVCVCRWKIQHPVQCRVLTVQHWDLSQPHRRQDGGQQTAAAQGKTLFFLFFKTLHSIYVFILWRKKLMLNTSHHVLKYIIWQSRPWNSTQWSVFAFLDHKRVKITQTSLFASSVILQYIEMCWWSSASSAA